MPGPVVNVLIDLAPGQRFRTATFDALAHAASACGVDAELRAVPTDEIDADFFGAIGDAVVMGPGTPYTRPDRAEEVVRLARERGVPLVGT